MTKLKFLRTLKSGLPLKHGSIWLETLGNWFQNIPNISSFDPENQKSFGFLGR